MTAPSRGMNKEQFAFVLMTILLGCAVYYYMASEPEKLKEGKPTIKVQAPRPVAARPDRDVNLEAFLKDGRNPFQFPKLVLSPVVAEKPPEKTGPVGEPPMPPPPPRPAETAAPREPPKPAWQARRAADLPVEFMGIVGTPDGEYLAVLRNKDGSPPIRARSGDTLDPSGIKILRIERERLFLEDADGQRYVVRDVDARSSGEETGGEKPKAVQPKKELPRKEPPKSVEKPAKEEKRPDAGEKGKPVQPLPKLEGEMLKKLQEALRNRNSNIIRNSSAGRRTNPARSRTAAAAPRPVSRAGGDRDFDFDLDDED
ncbi:MAG: hypothetical protein N3A38_10345 [Planctomycetota bacterium]|nr:hypothetical protein [Planctomycetota bacterium]